MACLLLAKSIFSMHFLRGTIEITRLDIMAYFDPASNPVSMPQGLSDESDKSCTWKKTFFGISCKTSDQKLYSQEKKNIVLFPSTNFAREITEPLRQIKKRINGL